MQSTTPPPADAKLTEEKIQEKLIEIIHLQPTEEDPVVKKNKVKFLSEKTIADLNELQKKLGEEMQSVKEARQKEKEKEKTSKYFKPILKPFNALFETYKAGGGILNTLIYFAVFAANLAAEILKPFTIGISGATALWGFIRATVDTSRRGNNVEQGVYGLRFGAFIATAVLLLMAVATPVTAFLLVVTTMVTGLMKDSYLALSAKIDVEKQEQIVDEVKATLEKYQALMMEAKSKAGIFLDPQNIATQTKLIEKYDSLCKLQQDLVKEEEGRLEKYKKDLLKERTRVGLTIMNLVGVALILIPGTQLAGFIVFGIACGLGTFEKTGSNPVSRFFGWVGEKIENYGKKTQPEAPEIAPKYEHEKKNELIAEVSHQGVDKVKIQNIFADLGISPAVSEPNPLEVEAEAKAGDKVKSPNGYAELDMSSSASQLIQLEGKPPQNSPIQSSEVTNEPQSSGVVDEAPKTRSKSFG